MIAVEVPARPPDAIRYRSHGVLQLQHGDVGQLRRVRTGICTTNMTLQRFGPMWDRWRSTPSAPIHQNRPVTRTGGGVGHSPAATVVWLCVAGEALGAPLLPGPTTGAVVDTKGDNPAGSASYLNTFKDNATEGVEGCLPRLIGRAARQIAELSYKFDVGYSIEIAIPELPTRPKIMAK